MLFFQKENSSSCALVRFAVYLLAAQKIVAKTMHKSCEVELKFFFQSIQQIAGIHGIKALGSKCFADIYFDSAKHDLTLRDVWLRKRQGAWELKIPMFTPQQAMQVDRYEEITMENDILQHLHKLFGWQANSLQEAPLVPLLTCHTNRTKFQYQDLIIDLDSASFDQSTFVYQIGEVEKMVASEAQVAEATQQVLEFCKQHQLEIASNQGKILEFLRHERKQHYELLSASPYTAHRCKKM